MHVSCIVIAVLYLLPSLAWWHGGSDGIRTHASEETGDITQWKYIIHTDLTSAFYQIPLAKASMKYCGVVTTFKGVRVYARSAMGMPGSETALEELMCRVLGELTEAGEVIKLADDLFCGANAPDALLSNWREVLAALHQSDLRLSAHKTTVALYYCPWLGLVQWHITSQPPSDLCPHTIGSTFYHQGT